MSMSLESIVYLKTVLLTGKGQESMEQDSREPQIKFCSLARHTGRELVALSYYFLLYK